MKLVKEFGGEQYLMSLQVGKEAFHRLASAFDSIQVHRARRALQAVRLPENAFDNLHPLFGRGHAFQLNQTGRNGADMFLRFDPKGREKSFQKFLILLAHFPFSDSLVLARGVALNMKAARRLFRRLWLPCSALQPCRQLPSL